LRVLVIVLVIVIVIVIVIAIVIEARDSRLEARSQRLTNNHQPSTVPDIGLRFLCSSS